jgi:putative hydrolase of the HAD superfamily
MRKPDVEIFRLALDLAQAMPERSVFIDNTPMLVQVAQRMGIRSILHVDYQSTSTKLNSIGLQTNDAT